MCAKPTSLLIDPRNPLCVPNLSGRLIHHDQECDACGGMGRFYDEDADIEGDPCDECDGEGTLRWPCWYGEDRAECFYCNEDDVLLAGIYEGGGAAYDAQYVCLPCYIKQHKEQCGCDKWAWAEKRIMGLL